MRGNRAEEFLVEGWQMVVVGVSQPRAKCFQPAHRASEADLTRVLVVRRRGLSHYGAYQIVTAWNKPCAQHKLALS